MRTTYSKQVLEALQRGDRLTHLDAMNRWGHSRLASTIHNLRRLGHKIQTKMIQNGRMRYGEYFID